MDRIDKIIFDLFGHIEVTTAGIYYKPLKDLIEYLEKINPQHYKVFCQPHIENEVKKIAKYYGVKYKTTKYLPEDNLIIVVDTEKVKEMGWNENI